MYIVLPSINQWSQRWPESPIAFRCWYELKIRMARSAGVKSTVQCRPTVPNTVRWYEPDSQSANDEIDQPSDDNGCASLIQHSGEVVLRELSLEQSIFEGYASTTAGEIAGGTCSSAGGVVVKLIWLIIDDEAMTRRHAADGLPQSVDSGCTGWFGRAATSRSSNPKSIASSSSCLFRTGTSPS